MKLTTHIPVLVRLRMSGATPVSPIRPRSVVRDNLTFKFSININVVSAVVNGGRCNTSSLLASRLSSVTERACIEDSGSEQREILGGKKEILRNIKWSSDLWTARTMSCAEGLVIVTCTAVRTEFGRTQRAVADSVRVSADKC
jgi:hypothetical protein